MLAHKCWWTCELSVLCLVLQNFCSLTSAIANNNDAASFHYCMRQSKHPRLSECVGRTAISFLQKFDEQDNFTIASDFISRKDDLVAARSLVNFLDTDPVDFRGILENAGAVFSQRSLEWHMDGLYPGLMFKIGPTADAKSVAEFALDPAINERNLGYEEPSTARVLAKQYLLPFLLGLKFNLVALVPLIFAAICLLLKKALFFAKLAIYVSSLLGVGGAVGALNSFGGGFGGLGSLLTGIGGYAAPYAPPLVQAQAHATAHAHAGTGGGGAIGVGYYPGKISAYQHYDNLDDLQHHSPYKRNDRKLNFEKQHEIIARDAAAAATVVATSTTVAPDRFYDFEKQVQVQDRNSKLHDSQLTAAYHNEEHRFKTSQQLGWKFIDVGALN